MENQSSRFRSFLARKQIEISLKRYFVDAMGAMAFGLFASLLIGTIFDAIAAGDADRAAALTTEHTIHAKESMIGRLKNHG